MALRFGKRSIFIGAIVNVFILAGALSGGLYLIITECKDEHNYNNLCKLGAALIWLGTLVVVALIFFTFFGIVIIRMEKEIGDLATGYAVTNPGAKDSDGAHDSENCSALSSTTSIAMIRPEEVPKTLRSNIPPKVENFVQATTLLKQLNQDQINSQTPRN